MFSKKSVDKKTVKIVQESFKKAAPVFDLVITMLHEDLLKLKPSLKDVFPVDEQGIQEQKSQLKELLTSAVYSLGDLKKIAPSLSIDYLKDANDHDLFGQAFISAFSKGVRRDFTEEVEEAWIKAYSAISATMQG
ncbi:MAG: hypothetical protein AB8B61_03375 [Cyclobacteriaceae bacterium]